MKKKVIKILPFIVGVIFLTLIGAFLFFLNPPCAFSQVSVSKKGGGAEFYQLGEIDPGFTGSVEKCVRKLLKGTYQMESWEAACQQCSSPDCAKEVTQLVLLLSANKCAMMVDFLGGVELRENMVYYNLVQNLLWYKYNIPFSPASQVIIWLIKSEREDIKDETERISDILKNCPRVR